MEYPGKKHKKDSQVILFRMTLVNIRIGLKITQVTNTDL